jgi:ABC-type oligopeptide transport system substrate-binding subunit
MENSSVRAILLAAALACLLGSAGCTAPAGVTLPANVTLPATLDPAVAESVGDLVVTARDLASAWTADGLTSLDKTCTATFTNADGDAATVTTTLCESEDAAVSLYTAERQRSGYRTFDLPIPDEGYGWQHAEAAQVGFRKGTVVVIVDYVSADGPATIAMAEEIAAIANMKL